MKPPIEFRPARKLAAAKHKGEMQDDPASGVGGSGLPHTRSSSNTTKSAPASFDRITYQREYMRRYRAKKAGK